MVVYFGERIRQKRKDLDWTQEDLADNIMEAVQYRSLDWKLWV